MKVNMIRSNVVWILLFGFAGLGNLGNGLFMMAAPETWYRELPAAVPDFGPYNAHFVRDIACVFTLLGIGSLLAAWKASLRFIVAVILALFSVSHGLVHIFDTARGLVGPEHWLIDLPLVYVPALVYLGMALAARKMERLGISTAGGVR